MAREHRIDRDSWPRELLSTTKVSNMLARDLPVDHPAWGMLHEDVQDAQGNIHTIIWCGSPCPVAASIGAAQKQKLQLGLN